VYENKGVKSTHRNDLASRQETVGGAVKLDGSQVMRRSNAIMRTCTIKCGERIGGEDLTLGKGSKTFERVKRTRDKPGRFSGHGKALRQNVSTDSNSIHLHHDWTQLEREVKQTSKR